MNRKQKEVAVSQLKADFASNNGSFLVNYKGMSVAQMQTLRKKLRETGAKIKVSKDRLIKIAVNDTPAQDLVPFLKEQIAVVFVEKDAGAAAKVVSDFAKNSSLSLVAGIVDSNLFDKDKLTRLASLPSREVLLAQLCGVLKANVSKLARSLSLVAEKKASESGSSVVKEEEKVELATEVQEPQSQEAAQNSAQDDENN